MGLCTGALGTPALFSVFTTVWGEGKLKQKQSMQGIINYELLHGCGLQIKCKLTTGSAAKGSTPAMMFPLGASFFVILGSLILKLVMSELGGETPPEDPTWEGVCQELPPDWISAGGSAMI